MGTQKTFLATEVPFAEEDHAVLSPVWLIPVEIFSRSMLKRPTYTYRTIVLDAMTGNHVIDFDGRLPWREVENSLNVRNLAPTVERSRVTFLAERSIGKDTSKGWRSIGSFTSVHVNLEKAELKWRLIVLKNGIPIDGLTAEPLEGSELLAALLFETNKDKNGGS